MIIIELTQKEAVALEQTGNANTRAAARDFIFIRLVLSGIGRDEAGQTAEELADVAETARRKIEAATRYEIKVIED